MLKEAFPAYQKEQHDCKGTSNAIKEMLISSAFSLHHFKFALLTSYIVEVTFSIRMSALPSPDFLKVIITQLFFFFFSPPSHF